MKKTVTKSLKTNLSQLKEILIQIFPRKKNEITLFIIFFVIYISYGIYLAFETCIIDYAHALRTDMYMGFDNIPIYYRGCFGNTNHPLMRFFLKPFLILGNIVIFFFGAKAKTVLCVSVCSSLISLSVVYVYRYLKQIIMLKGYILWLITVFFGFFSTNLILCFTLESFTLSAFLLSFSVYYYSAKIKNNRKINFLPNFLLAFGLGGITITNFVKGIIPMFFTTEKLKLKLGKIVVLTLMFAAMVAYVVIFHTYGYTPLQHYENFSFISPKHHYIESCCSFLGANIFFPSIIWDWDPYLTGHDYEFGMLNISIYQHIWQYILLAFVYIPVVFAMLKGYKNKFIQMLVLLFGCDITIHIILNFGMHEVFLYGGHWVYVIPLFFGWAYSSLAKKQATVFSVILSCLLIIIVINNIIELGEFIRLALHKYPADTPTYSI